MLRLGKRRPTVALGRHSAESAGLRYTTSDSPGLRRERRGAGFVYRDGRGKLVRDRRTLARIRSLALPPAWTDVWIARDPRAHLQATGRDAAGRKQYRYHPDWTAVRDSTKYRRLVAFADALPAIRRRSRRDMMGPVCGRPRVLATVVELLERTLIRVGNEEYARKNRSHGLTTLRDRHVKVRGRRIRFAFRAKSGILQQVDLDEPRLATAVRQCQDLPGQTLFRYLDDRGRVRSLSSSDVNAYLRDATGGAFTAKDFRTWAGTLATAEELDKADPQPSKAAVKRAVVKAIDAVADALGNTRAVCRKNYVHPAVVAAFLEGVTLSHVVPNRSRALGGLRDAEARLVSLLLRMERRKAA